MAFLSHSLPWHVFSSMFEYADRSDPGPQHPELWAKDKPGQRKQIEYFACKFQDTIHEHSRIERQRYKSGKEYAERASKWTVSERGPSETVEATSTEGTSVQRESQQPSRRKEDVKTRPQPHDPWTPSPTERRRVYPADFSIEYMSYVPITSGSWTGREGIVEDFAHIENWIDFAARDAEYTANQGTSEEHNQLWLDRRSCLDILRLSIIDAATTTDSARRTHTVETLFLLAHHPRIRFNEISSAGMSCCNLGIGLDFFVHNITQAFLYLNLLWTLVDGNPASALLQPRDYLHLYDRAYYRDSTFETLLPRPAYMNTHSFHGLFSNVLLEHGHAVEHVFFNPLIAPYASGRRSKYMGDGIRTSAGEQEDVRKEQDVLADLPALKESWKAMWKMLVVCDMLLAEIGEPVEWDYEVVRGLEALFPWKNGIERLLGMSWSDYDYGHQVRQDDGKDGREATE